MAHRCSPWWFLVVLPALARPSTADTVVYANDFEGRPGTSYPEWTSSRIGYESRSRPPGSGTREAPAVINAEWPRGRHRRFLGEFGGPRLDPTARTRVGQAVRLRLTGLAPHSRATVSFDLLVLRSWDGKSPAYGPDRFRLAVAGGPTLLETTFSNNPKVDSDRSLQDYPAPDSPPRAGAASTGTLDDGFFADSIYRLTFTFPHSADALTLEFASDLFEGKGTEDEAWGLDDVTIRTDAPGPAPKPKPNPPLAPPGPAERPLRVSSGRRPEGRVVYWSRPRRFRMAETYVGEVKNGVVVFDEGVPHPPEGTKVQVAPVEPSNPSRTLAERYSAIIGIAEGLPPDMALEHDHYIHGTPRRSEG